MIVLGYLGALIDDHIHMQPRTSVVILERQNILQSQTHGLSPYRVFWAFRGSIFHDPWVNSLLARSQFGYLPAPPASFDLSAD